MTQKELQEKEDVEMARRLQQEADAEAEAEMVEIRRVQRQFQFPPSPQRAVGRDGQGRGAGGGDRGGTRLPAARATNQHSQGGWSGGMLGRANSIGNTMFQSVVSRFGAQYPGAGAGAGAGAGPANVYDSEEDEDYDPNQAAAYGGGWHQHFQHHGQQQRHHGDGDDDDDLGTYEELLALDDKVKPKGLSKDEIAQYTFKQTLKKEDIPKLSVDNCVICLDEFRPRQSVLRLPCLCVFHTKCITRHLKGNVKCPIDQTDIRG